MNKSIKELLQARDKLADVYDIEHSQVERLRLILEEEQGRSFTFEEAQKVGGELKSFFRLLAGGRKIVRGGLKNTKRFTS